MHSGSGYTAGDGCTVLVNRIHTELEIVHVDVDSRRDQLTFCKEGEAAGMGGQRLDPYGDRAYHRPPPPPSPSPPMRRGEDATWARMDAAYASAVRDRCPSVLPDAHERDVYHLSQSHPGRGISRFHWVAQWNHAIDPRYENTPRDATAIMHSGWAICVKGASGDLPSAPPAPPSFPAGSSPFVVRSGPCKIHGACVTSGGWHERQYPPPSPVPPPPSWQTWQRTPPVWKDRRPQEGSLGYSYDGAWGGPPPPPPPPWAAEGAAGAWAVPPPGPGPPPPLHWPPPYAKVGYTYDEYYSSEWGSWRSNLAAGGGYEPHERCEIAVAPAAVVDAVTFSIGHDDTFQITGPQGEVTQYAGADEWPRGRSSTDDRPTPHAALASSILWVARSLDHDASTHKGWALCARTDGGKPASSDDLPYFRAADMEYNVPIRQKNVD